MMELDSIQLDPTKSDLSVEELQSLADSEVQEQESTDLEFKYDRSLRGEGNERLLETWDQLNVEGDIAVQTAILLSGVHYFGYALTESNRVNGRQGKSRVTFTNEQRKLMEHALDENVDTFIDKKLNDLFFYIVSTYLIDKQTLPESKPKKALGIEGRVKSLMIMLFATNQYDIIPKLQVPYYVQPQVDKVFKKIYQEQDEVLDLWIQYLEQHESQELADHVRDLGDSFWGSEYMTSGAIWTTKFKGMIHLFKNLAETYDAYLKFRTSYIKVTRSIPRNELFGIFDLTDDKYDKFRKTVLNDFQQLFTEDENALAIQKLIYEY